MFAYFLFAIWLFYQLLIHACSEANFREIIFFRKFFSDFSFQCEMSGQTCSLVRTCMALLINDLTVCHPDKWVTRLDASPLLSMPSAQHCIFFSYFCYVVCVFSQICPDILASFIFSTHVFSFSGIFFDFSYSFKQLFFL
jgi:hypothetical protein